MGNHHWYYQRSPPLLLCASYCTKKVIEAAVAIDIAAFHSSFQWSLSPLLFLPVIIKILKSGLLFFMSFAVSVAFIGKIFYGDMPPTSVIPWCAVLAIAISFLIFKIIGWDPPGENE